MLKSGIFILSMLFLVTFSSIERTQLSFEILKLPSIYSKWVEPQDSIKKQAFDVLELKCNFCHTSKKRLETFTLENMNGLIPKINEQVFIKSRMPKGKNNELTTEEKNSLLIWINKEFQH